jgi:hypothetical protein
LLSEIEPARTRFVYAAGRTTYTLREKLSLALARTKCTLVGFGPPPVNA